MSNGPGARVFVTVSVKEVTEAITGKIDPKLDDRKRYDVVDRRTKERVAACEAEAGLRCSVTSFFGGLKYFEIAQLEIQDVRLAYAPAVGIGNFGGETDNWRWPRHTGDWSFFRAYVGKDGKPAAFSKDNVPYRPAHWLPVQPAGIEEGDLVFVVGYPGRTQRHQTYAEVKETTEWTFPRFIKTSQEQIDILETLGRTNEELQIKAASRLRGLNNYLTNRKGMLEGLVKGGILAKKSRTRRTSRRGSPATPHARSSTATFFRPSTRSRPRARRRGGATPPSRASSPRRRCSARRTPRTSSRSRRPRGTTWTARPSTRSGTGRAPERASNARSARSTRGSTRRS